VVRLRKILVLLTFFK